MSISAGVRSLMLVPQRGLLYGGTTRTPFIRGRSRPSLALHASCSNVELEAAFVFL
jgi:hypothetical protein